MIGDTRRQIRMVKYSGSIGRFQYIGKGESNERARK